MKPRRVVHGLQYAIGIVVALILSLLFYNSQVQVENYRRIDGLLMDMRDEVANIHQQLVELQAGSQHNYDRLSAAEVALHLHLRKLQQDHEDLVGLVGDEPALEHFRQLKDQWELKYRAIEDFKARHALQKNLLLYAPKNIEDLFEAVRSSPALDAQTVREIEILLHQLAIGLFREYNPVSSSEQRFAERLTGMQGELLTRLPENLQKASDRLFDRLQLISVIGTQLTSALRTAASPTLGDHLHELQALLRERLAWKTDEARNYRVGLYLLGLLLLLYLARVILRMQQLGRHLKTSLSELEFQKRALDEHNIVSITDARGDILYANDFMCEISGYRREELLGQNHRILKSGLHDANFYRKLWRQLVSKGKWQGEIVNRSRSGRLYWVATTLLARYDENGKPWQYIGIRTDITAQKKAEQEARMLARFPSENPDPVLRLGPEGRVLYGNPASERLLEHWGVEEADPLPPEWLRVVSRCLDSGRMENHDIHMDGEHFELRFTPMPSEGYVNVYGRNTTEIKQAEAHLNYQARHDALTGLCNRSAFEQFLEEALQRAQDNEERSLLLYIDLDQFKVVNDTSGHVAGDELLRQLSERFSGCIRESDTLARLGGDEFGVLLRACDLSHGRAVAQKLLQMINEYRFLWQAKTFKIGASIGISVIDNTRDSAVQLLGEADIACYAAKDKGRNRVEVFEAGQDLEKRRNEMHWASVIPEALAKGRFELHAQRIEPLQQNSGEQAHYELLLRLRDEAGGLIPPGAFLPAAERYGLISSIDLWVVEQAFERLEASGQPLSVAINLSGHSIGDEQFLGFLLEKLDAHRLDPSLITFEITETSAIANLGRALALIESLRKRGCRFALDDFGSGLSSFAYLKNLPVDYLKIDGAFVRDILDDPIDEAMVQAINQIGHVMGIRTIAEFVENEAIEKQLRLMQVDFAQGYGVHRPQPLSEILQSAASGVECGGAATGGSALSSS